MNRRGRPKSSDRLRREDCAALTIGMVRLPMRHPMGTETETTVEGVIGGVRQFRIRVRVTRTQRGWRFLCPECGRHSAVLYFPPDSVEAECRVCLRLVYECQYDKLPAWASVMRAITEDLRRRHRLRGLTESKPGLS